MLHNFKSFNDDFILESINESILYFTPRVREQLKLMDNKIAKDLLDSEGMDIKDDITFIDIDTSDEGKVTFSKMQHALAYTYYPYSLLDKESNIDMADKLWHKNSTLYDKSRNSIKIGKIVNKILTNKYSPREIEIFSNEFKAKSSINKEVIRLVSGKEIEHWYNIENYLSEYGTLGNSCMSGTAPNGKNKYGENFFKIYTENPDSCSLLIMTIGDKLVARALVWKIDTIKSRNRKYQIPDDIKDMKYFMDRVYYLKDYQEVKLVNYAVSKGWGYNNIWIRFSCKRGYAGVKYKGSDWDLDLTVKVKPGSYEPYPYLDTFSRYDEKNGILHNDNSYDKIGHILRDTTGGYRPSISRVKATLNKIKKFKDLFN